MLRPGMTKLEKWLPIKFGPYCWIMEVDNGGFGVIRFIKKNGDFGAV